MLAAADAGVVARDPVLPGLRRVLDPQACAELVDAALPGGWVLGAEPRYVRYKPGGSCLVAYRFDTAGGSLDGFAKAYHADAAGKAAKVADGAVPSAAGGPGVVVADDERVAVQLFPNDRELPALRRLGTPPGRTALLATLLPPGCDPGAAALVPLRYKPERRWVARVDGLDGPAAALRLYAGPVPAGAVAAFAGDADLRLPRMLGRRQRHAAVLVAWLTGAPLPPALGRGGEERLADVGAALAALHGQRPKGLPRRTSAHEAAAVAAAAQLVTALLPDLTVPVRRLARAVNAFLTATETTVAVVHGDFSPDQVLLGDTDVAILDLDEAAIGDPAEDLGRFAAALQVGALDGGGEPGAWTAALVDGYASRGRAPDRQRLAVQTVASLLRVAAEPFRSRRPDWPDRVGAVVARAEQLWRRQR